MTYQDRAFQMTLRHYVECAIQPAISHVKKSRQTYAANVYKNSQKSAL